MGLRLNFPNASTICYVEIEAYVCAFLEKRMREGILDDAPIWTNLKSFDGKPWCGKVDCLTAGYPCQPFSIAGKKPGEKDPRHLWPEVCRVIRECQPAICFLENVGAHLRMGFEQVHDDLCTMGYEIKSGLFTAEEVGAPHKRERLFILAYNPRLVRERCFGERAIQWQSEVSVRCGRQAVADRNSDGFGYPNCPATRKNDLQKRQECFKDTLFSRDGFTTRRFSSLQTRFRKIMADILRFRWCRRSHVSKQESFPSTETSRTISPYETLPLWPPRPNEQEQWQRIPTNLKPTVHRMADGMANWVDRLRACGNGVVPLVAAYAFRILCPDFENLEKEK